MAFYLWRCLYFLPKKMQLRLSSPSGRDAEKFSFWKYILIYILLHFSTFIYIFYKSATETVLPLGETLKSFWSLFTFSNLDLLLSGPRVFTRCFILISNFSSKLRQFWFRFLTTFAPSLPHQILSAKNCLQPSIHIFRKSKKCWQLLPLNMFQGITKMWEIGRDRVIWTTNIN